MTPPRVSSRLIWILSVFAGCGPAAAQRGDAPEARLRPADDQLALFHLPPGFAIQLIAAEPALGKPLNLAFDAAGRLWVTTTLHYPWPARTDALGRPIADFTRDWEDNHLAFRGLVRPPEPETQARDQLLVLSDFDPATGRAGRVEVFADGLNIPVGVVPLPRAAGARGAAVIAHSIPGIWRLKIPMATGAPTAGNCSTTGSASKTPTGWLRASPRGRTAGSTPRTVSPTAVKSGTAPAA